MQRAAQQVGLPFPDLSGGGAAEREAHSLVFMEPMHRIQETWYFLNLIDHYETVLGRTHLIERAATGARGKKWLEYYM